MLVDLSGHDSSGYDVQVMVNPDHITAMTDESGSYWRKTKIYLIGGKTVYAPHSLHTVKKKLQEALDAADAER